MTDAEKLEALEKLLERWDSLRDMWARNESEDSVDYIVHAAMGSELSSCIHDVRRILDK